MMPSLSPAAATGSSPTTSPGSTSPGARDRGTSIRRARYDERLFLDDLLAVLDDSAPRALRAGYSFAALAELALLAGPDRFAASRCSARPQPGQAFRGVKRIRPISALTSPRQGAARSALGDPEQPQPGAAPTARVRARAVRPHPARASTTSSASRCDARPADELPRRPCRSSSRWRARPLAARAARTVRTRIGRGSRCRHRPQPIRDGAAPTRTRHDRPCSAGRRHPVGPPTGSSVTRRGTSPSPSASAASASGAGETGSSRPVHRPALEGRPSRHSPRCVKPSAGDGQAREAVERTGYPDKAPDRTRRSCRLQPPGQVEVVVRSARSRCTMSRSRPRVGSHRVVRPVDRRMPQQRADDDEVAADVEVPRSSAAARCRRRTPGAGDDRRVGRVATSAARPRPANRVRARVGVEPREHVAGCRVESGRRRGPDAAHRLVDDLRACAARDLGRGIRGAVVDDDDLVGPARLRRARRGIRRGSPRRFRLGTTTEIVSITASLATSAATQHSCATVGICKGGFHLCTASA